MLSQFPETLNNLSFSRFKACFQVFKTLRLPPFTGSTIRGALGHALKMVHYGEKPACSGCPSRPECRYGNLYTYFFEAPWDHPLLTEAHQGLPSDYQRQTYPRPFILEPPAGGVYESTMTLSLPFSLVGRAVAHLPFFICALERLKDLTVGSGGGSLTLLSVTDGLVGGDGPETIIYDGSREKFVGGGQIFDLSIVERRVGVKTSLAGPLTLMRLRFLTPFNFKYENKFRSPLTFNIFLRNLFRRLTILSVHSPLAEYPDFRGLLRQAEEVVAVSADLRWLELERYSQRYQDRMKYGGYVGEVCWRGDVHPFLPFLKLGEFLHVGKMASFGLGHYELTILPEVTDSP